MPTFRITCLKVLACALIMLALSVPGWSQPVTITGIGLSGSLSSLDSTVSAGEAVSVVISFNREVGFDVQGLALDDTRFDSVTVHYYAEIEPQSSPIGRIVQHVPRASLLIDTVSIPNQVRFNFVLGGNVDINSQSLQLEARLFGVDANQISYVSEPRASHVAVGQALPVNDPVDALHATYLLYDDVVTLPPDLMLPQSGNVLSRDFPVRFALPENAAPGTLLLTFEAINGTEQQRRVYLHNHEADSAREVRLDASALYLSQDVDSVIGLPASLTHLGLYRLTLSYRDVALNPAAQDTVSDLLVDILTETPNLIEPTAGSTAPPPSVRVIYELPELADTVQLTFEVDSLSPVPDSRSPHILTLTPDVNGPGAELFYLDGTQIGTGGPYVLFNNNGDQDELVYGAVYTVSLTYGDTINNPPVTVSNSGYNWPEDLATARPLLLEPHPGMREDETFWIQFFLPEVALQGSVYLIFQSVIGPDPGSPHYVTLGNLTASGFTEFFLNAIWFSFSDLVTDVQGSGTIEENNTLVHGTRYRVVLHYRDAAGNNSNADTSQFILFDIATDSPTILLPLSGDTLSLLGTEVRYHQTENAIPGTLRIVLTQTGGPDPDFLSPHTLFLSNPLGGFGKSIILQPGQLGNSTGVDSVHNDGSLVVRGLYRLSLEYQDTLGNPPSSAFVENLYLPSGSSVFARGRSQHLQVIPGGTNHLVFELALRTIEGASLLRGLNFFNDGGLVPADVNAAQSFVWSSVDSAFDPTMDTPAGSLDSWTGGDINFDNISVGISSLETFAFVSLSYSNIADPSHTVNLMLLGPESVDCGGDAVIADSWPIGEPDIPLPAFIINFIVEQDTSFGSLRLRWTVASELNNEGFNVLRREESESDYHVIASYSNTPSLVGRGTATSEWSYTFTDHGLVPGRTYHYRLEAVTSENFYTLSLEAEASGSPRLPPSDFILSDAYPNPFNQVVTIKYIVPYSAVVELIVYDVQGREVRTLVRALLPASDYQARWDGRTDTGITVPSGIYFCRMRAAGGRFEQTAKLLLIR